MSKQTSTIQGQAWDELARSSYGSEHSMNTIVAANSDEADVLFFSGNVNVSLPIADANKKIQHAILPWER